MCSGKATLNVASRVLGPIYDKWSNDVAFDLNLPDARLCRVKGAIQENSRSALPVQLPRS